MGCIDVGVGELRPDVVVQAIENSGRDRAKRVTPIRQPYARRTTVRRITLTPNEPRSLHEPDERRHRLLRQPCSDGESTHAKAILLEQRKQHRSIRWSDLLEAAATELVV